MELRIILCTLIFTFFFSSCNFINDKLGDYYFNKAKKIAESDEATENDVDRFYDYMMKSLDYKVIKQSVPLVEKVTDASLRAGYIKAYENELKFFKKYVEKDPKAWEVYLNIINIFALKGDLYNLNNLKEDFEKRVINDKNFKLLSFIVLTNLLYWTASYGETSLNISFDELIGHLANYCNYFKEIVDIKLLNDSGFFKDADKSLYYYFNNTLNDFLLKEDYAKRNCEIYLRIKNDQNFMKMVKYAVDANKYLSKKEYKNALIFYKSALSIDENFYDAKKNMIEAEFQDKLALSLMKKDKTDVENLVYDKIQDINVMINDCINKKYISKLPFYDNDGFISQLYSLKAAMLSILVNDEITGNKRDRLIKSIKKSLNEALKYDPKNKIARELSVRFEDK